MSKTTYPPKSRIRRPSKSELVAALEIVKAHKIDWHHPWPDAVADNTIRWMRREGLVETSEWEGAIQMAQNNFGHSWVEDVITDKGRQLLEVTPDER